jgi:ABC-type nitrate/sulfonate/bicarbonate transport system substrate-binding protein
VTSLTTPCIYWFTIGSALTDALIAGIANGSKAYKLVGSYVSTPLNWSLPVSATAMYLAHPDDRAVITGAKSKYQSLAELEGTPIGISRVGSGSQTMAYVMARQQGWATDTLRFKGP